LIKGKKKEEEKVEEEEKTQDQSVKEPEKAGESVGD